MTVPCRQHELRSNCLDMTVAMAEEGGVSCADCAMRADYALWLMSRPHTCSRRLARLEAGGSGRGMQEDTVQHGQCAPEVSMGGGALIGRTRMVFEIMYDIRSMGMYEYVL